MISRFARHAAIPFVARPGLSKEVKTTLKQNAITQAVGPLAVAPSLKDDLGTANSSQTSQLRMRSVATRVVLNMSHETPASLTAEVG